MKTAILYILFIFVIGYCALQFVNGALFLEHQIGEQIERVGR